MKIRYYGHVGQTTGYGKAAEAMCMALLAAGCDVEIRPLSPYEHVRVDPRLPLARCIRRDWELTPPDAAIVHTLPLDCARVVEIASLETFDVPLVAYTTYDGVGVAPRLLGDAFGAFDIVWTPSSVNTASFALGSSGTTRFATMPHAFDETTLEVRRGLDVESGDRPYTFYYLGAWTGRKNPEGVMRAFVHAFERSEPVQLVMRSAGTDEDAFTIGLHRTGMTPATSPRMLFSNRAVSDEGLWAFHRQCDTFVTAARAEGWNLPAFDAMLAGRHVISPGGLGSDEFLLRTSAMFCRGTKQPAACDVRMFAEDADSVRVEVTGAQGLSSKATWQEPDLLHLSSAMRTAYEQRITKITTEYDLAEMFGHHAVGKQARALLEGL